MSTFRVWARACSCLTDAGKVSRQLFFSGPSVFGMHARVDTWNVQFFTNMLLFQIFGLAEISKMVPILGTKTTTAFGCLLLCCHVCWGYRATWKV